MSATSVLVCTVSVFDWKASIAIQLSSLILFLQSSYLVFHHNFADWKHQVIIIGSCIIFTVEHSSFQTLQFKDQQSFYQISQVLADSQSNDFGQCSPITEPN
jgi:hypothetical protein